MYGTIHNLQYLVLSFTVLLISHYKIKKSTNAKNSNIFTANANCA